MRRLAISLVLLGVVSGTAEAAVLYAGPLTPGPGNELSCRIANVSNRTRAVTIEVFDYAGALQSTSNSISLAPLASAPWTVYDDGINTVPRLCRFTVEGGKGDYRTSACVTDISSIPLSCVPGE